MTPNSSSQRLDQVQRQLMQLPGVAAVGQTEREGRVALKVYFVDSTAAAAAQLPPELDSVPIVTVVSGEFDAS